jgi:tRNA (cmo5U34)-methyltransferase
VHGKIRQTEPNFRPIPEKGKEPREMAIDMAFNKTVEYYDRWIRKAVPGYEQLFAVAKELVPFASDASPEVLDLGAGTGLFSLQILEKCPLARFTLWDVAGKMLDVARERFRGHPGQFRYVTDDYRNLGNAGCFDLVISSLSIHHLEDGEKRKLFRDIHGVLGDGGIFVNIDLIRGPTPALEDFYLRNWLDKIRQAGASEEEIQAGIERRQAFDKDSTMAEQITWLSEAGFTDVDCVYRNFKMGLFYAASGSGKGNQHAVIH